MSIQNDSSLVLRMNTEIPLPHGITVKDLIAVLQMVPDQNARVSGYHYSGDRFSSTTYKLKLDWTKVVAR